MSADACHDRSISPDVTAAAESPVGAAGGAQSGVVTDAAVDWSEWLPAASYASTVYE